MKYIVKKMGKQEIQFDSPNATKRIIAKLQQEASEDSLDIAGSQKSLDRLKALIQYSQGKHSQPTSMTTEEFSIEHHVLCQSDVLSSFIEKDIRPSLGADFSPFEFDISPIMQSLVDFIGNYF